ncbi:MAG: M20/M25/M40 family metallo-hydrolase [Acetobacteraceae bacterium]|nr:M20/M25/M40 family metallo-hydrolase [Acetobacteraceae bacterium]
MAVNDRARAIEAALSRFDQGEFRARLAELVAIRSTSQEPSHGAELDRYLREGVAPWLSAMGFAVAIHANPALGLGPILVAHRHEGDGLPRVLFYGHGDTVRGLDEQWSAGLSPWRLTERNGLWYGRGTADNKGQHALGLAALEAVIEARRGRLGFNLTALIETAEERGSGGLRDFVASHREALAADVLIGSDGPRVSPDEPTIACGSRGSFHFDLVIRRRAGGVHSGHWGGIARDPAVELAHVLVSICDRNGRILVRDWLPRAIPPAVTAALVGCPVDGGDEAAAIDPEWGEPGLTPAEKIYAWTGFIVLAMVAGQPDAPLNALAPEARAHCQLRHTVDVDPARFVPSLRAHLDAAGFRDVAIENAGVRMAASRTDPAHPWVRFAAASLAATLGRPPRILPNASGGLPGDVFVEELGTPLVWIPHSYNGCRQHGPDEHADPRLLREGMAAMAGLWWDIGEGGTPRAA